MFGLGPFASVVVTIVLEAAGLVVVCVFAIDRYRAYRERLEIEYLDD